MEAGAGRSREGRTAGEGAAVDQRGGQAAGSLENEENDVLVNYMIYAPEFGADIGNYHAEAKRWLCMAIPCTVTHWMPLPEAPKFADVLRGAPEALEAHNGKENS